MGMLVPELESGVLQWDGGWQAVIVRLGNVRAGRMTVLLALTLAKRVVRRRMEGMLSGWFVVVVWVR